MSQTKFLALSEEGLIGLTVGDAAGGHWCPYPLAGNVGFRHAMETMMTEMEVDCKKL